MLVLLSLAGGMIISRLLTPAQTGIYSVAAVLLGVAQVLRDFGAGQYLVQERELTRPSCARCWAPASCSPGRWRR